MRVAIASLAIACAHQASGQSLGVGSVVFIETDGAIPYSALTGGDLRLRNPDGFAMQLEATNLFMSGGRINLTNSQMPGSTFTFNGTTTVAGPAPGTSRPADRVYLGADEFDSAGMSFINNGLFRQFDQTIVLRGRPTLVNETGKTFEMRANARIVAEGFYSGLPGFLNKGFFRKEDGGGIGTIDARFDQINGAVGVLSGSLVLNFGGTHRDSLFAANPLGTNSNGAIAFNGHHEFRGINTTTTGAFAIGSGSSMTVNAGEWRQEALLVASGNINLVNGAVLRNSGTIGTAAGARIVGNSVGFPANPGSYVITGSFINSGQFAGEIGSTPTGERVGAENSGQFIVAAGKTVEVAHLVQNAGTLQVNGTLTTSGSVTTSGMLQHLGGTLSGAGIINGDVFTGGGPGVAVFNPGNSPGTMTINGEFSLLSGGVLNLEIERTPGGLVFDQVIANSFSLNGRVNFLVGAGVTLSDVIGLSFLDCGGCDINYGGNFSFDFPGRPGSVLFADASGLHITALAPVPEPGMLAMVLAGLGLVGFGARRRIAA